MTPFCNHVGTPTEVRLKRTTDNRKMVMRQCLKCGCSIGAALSQKAMSIEELYALPKWDDALQKSHYDGIQIACDKIKTDAEKKAEKWWDDYEIYMNSPEWREKASRVKRRDDYTCRGCGAAQATCVHHLSYANFGDELLFQLVALCRPCHEKCHAKRGLLPI